MITPDTSVVVAAFAPWHDHHDVANERLASSADVSLISGVAAETLSTLTRLPDPFRVDAKPVWDFLAARFPRPWITPTARQSRAILGRAIDGGISGGAIYDALIAGAASAGDATLLSLDRRAQRTYLAMAARFELLA